MNIALLYSGQIRHVKETYENHKKYIFESNKNHNLDFFCHFWKPETINDEYNYWKTGNNQYDIENYINSIWNIKKIIIENQIKFNKLNLVSDPSCFVPLENILSMFYSLHQCNKLKQKYEVEKKIKYDCVIRLRTDLYFKFDAPLIIDKLDLNGINIPRSRIHRDYGIYDWFALGNSNNMDIYCDIYNNIKFMHDEGAIINPECLLGYFLIKKNKIKLIENEWDFWRNIVFYRNEIESKFNLK